MPSLFEPQVRASILGRISRLTAERKPVWGRFTAPEMVCHVSGDLRQGLGELDAGPPSGPVAVVPNELARYTRHALAKRQGQEPT